MTRIRRVLAAGMFLVPYAVVTLALSPPDILRGERYPDTDDYSRLLRVRTLVETGAWFDGSLPRSNWPEGDTLHWTRPVDVALLAVTLPATPLVGFERALRLASVVVPPLLLLAIMAASAWGASALAGGTGWVFVPLFLLVQPAVLAYGAPGRTDHHALILLCLALSLGFLFRAMGEPSRTRWAVGLGVTAGVGLWLSPEYLLPLGIFLLVGMWGWIRDGEPRARFHLAWTLVMTATAGVALAVERGPGFLAVEYDRISVVHVLVAALAAGVWWLAREWERRAGGGPLGRAAVGLGAGAVALAIMAQAFPPFFGGPMVEVTDPVVRGWLGQVRELRPTLWPDDARGLTLLLVNAGAAMAVLGWLGREAWLEWRTGQVRASAGPRVLLLVGLTVSMGLALAQIRWLTYVQLLAAPGAALLVARAGTAHPGWGGGPAFVRSRGRIAAGAVLMFGPVLAGLGASLLLGRESAVAAPAGAACDGEAIAAFLAELGGGEPLTVAAGPDRGPVILYRTPHRVWATPYHRNRGGIRKSYDLFAAVDAEGARALAAASRPHLMVICPRADQALFPLAVEGRATLFGRLVEGDVPPWLEEVVLPDSLEGVRVFLVRPGD